MLELQTFWRLLLAPTGSALLIESLFWHADFDYWQGREEKYRIKLNDKNRQESMLCAKSVQASASIHVLSAVNVTFQHDTAL